MLNHAVIGDFKANNRPKGGGHSEQAISELNRRSISYSITRASSNGVRFGNIPSHDAKSKRTGEGQTWFPQLWTEHDIYAAGIAAANKGQNIHGYGKEILYNGVNVRAIYTNGVISSVMPSYDQKTRQLLTRK